MPQQVKPVLPTLVPQILYQRRRRYASLPIQIHIQLSVTSPHNRQVQYSQLIEENPGWLEESWQVTSLIILGIFLMLVSKTAHNRHNITLLLAYTSWRGHPNRGWGQSYGQGNNIAVRGGNASHLWPWQNQPYGCQTRSQQALRACTYQKWQHRHNIL